MEGGKLFSIPRILTVVIPEELIFSSCEQYNIQLCLNNFKSPALTALTLTNKTIEPIVITRHCVGFFLWRKHILWILSLIRTWKLPFIHISAFKRCVLKKKPPFSSHFFNSTHLYHFLICYLFLETVIFVLLILLQGGGVRSTWTQEIDL